MLIGARVCVIYHARFIFQSMINASEVYSEAALPEEVNAYYLHCKWHNINMTLWCQKKLSKLTLLEPLADNPNNESHKHTNNFNAQSTIPFLGYALQCTASLLTSLNMQCLNTWSYSVLTQLLRPEAEEPFNPMNALGESVNCKAEKWPRYKAIGQFPKRQK